MPPRSQSAAPVPRPAASDAAPAPPVALAFTDPRAPFLLPLLALLACRVAGWRLLPFASEDAYITYRYARNLAVGNGPVFNPGEAVFGFSSPLWTAWSALAFLLHVDPVVWAKAWSVAADGITLLLVTRLLLRHGAAAAWCFAGFFAVWPYFSAVCASGMEVNVALALLVAGAVLAERKSPASGPVLALLALSRPEGVALAAVAALLASWRDRLVALGLFAAGLALLYSAFGTVVPQSVAAKASVYGTPGPWSGRHWWEWIVPLVVGPGIALNDTAYLTILRLLMFPAAVMGVAALARPPRGALAAIVAGCLIVWAAYAVLGVVYFSWYLLIPLAGISIAAAAGASRVVRGRAVAVAVALYVTSVWTIAGVLHRARAEAEYRTFGAVGAYLLESAAPGDLVLLEPIGIIGYSAPVHVLDEVGLVTPSIAKRRREGPGWYADVVASRRPQWIVARRGFLRTGAAFAGAGAPFRSEAERDSTFAPYGGVFATDGEDHDLALVVLRRRP